MALQVDGSTPAAVVGATTTLTTASFSPPANSRLVAYGMGDAGDGSTETLTVTSTGGLSWTMRVRANGSPGATVEVWDAPAVSAPGSITVSMTGSGGATDKRLYVVVYTDSGGGIPAGVGATNTSASTSVAYTSTVANSWGYGVGLGGGGTPVAGTGQTLVDSDTSFDGGDGTWVLQQNATTTTPGTTVTMSVTAPSSVVHFAAAEILPMSTTTFTGTPPVRTVQTRDPSNALWNQRDRRNAVLVGSAVNTNPSPLDSAYQAGARYWHLYGDAADAAPRTWQSLQRVLTSDPSLLGPTTTDPLTLAAGVGGDMWRRVNGAAYGDRRLVPQQRPYVSNPSLLGTALLENELLGGADTVKRYQVPVYAPDRREVPQQRLYVSDPSMLGTALLENELLGGADDRTRHLAWYTSRRLVPQQDSLASDPSLLTQAPFDPTLAGPLDVEYLVASTHVDRRRTVPQRQSFADIDQVSVVGTGATMAWWGVDDTAAYTYGTLRRYMDASSQVPVPFDPTLGAWLPLWLSENRAATHVDRREVPQQRLYISDPSFYPTVAPTDPLTLAWGAGGTYWSLYNSAAEHVDRREVPQQRLYVSDPSMLGTALLENELLGGADDRTRHLAWYTDRREVPQQRLYISDPGTYPSGSTDPLTLAWGASGPYWLLYNAPAQRVDRREVPQQRPYTSIPGLLATALLENELLGGADDRARHAAWYTDRREVPQQPIRWTAQDLLYTDPLALSGGTGGDMWRRYSMPATHKDRRQLARQPERWTLYFSPDIARPGRLTVYTISGRVAPYTTSARISPYTSGGEG